MQQDNGLVIYVCGSRSFHAAHPGRKIAGVVESWRRRGYAVEHVCGGDFVGAAVAGGEVNAFGGAAYFNSWYRRVPGFDAVAHSVSEWRDLRHDEVLLQSLRALVKRRRPVLIWERSARLHQAGLIIAREIGVPYVLEWKDHLVPYRHSLYARRALRMEHDKTLAADFAVVESGVLRDQLVQEGVGVEKILVAHNAVDADEFAARPELRKGARARYGLTEDDVAVGYLGSYAFYHDVLNLVRAAALLPSASPLKILLIGAGKDYTEARRLAAELGVLDRVLFQFPAVAAKEVPAVLSALDAAVLPGSTDIICPIKVQEYMAAGLPTVIPDYPCNQEVIVHQENGILFAPCEPAALAKALVELAGNTPLREQLGRRAREAAIHRFGWDATWGQALTNVLQRANVVSQHAAA